MILYQTIRGPVVESKGQLYAVNARDWDSLFNSEDLHSQLREAVANQPRRWDLNLAHDIAAPIGSQEIWAAGVTYLRSKSARMEESHNAGASDFYDRVYAAQRPEIFFKATPQRIVKPGGVMKLRSDSKWMVPEPELTLAINCRGKIIGFTAGNDLSCRDIEAENPLYLPQAKCFKGCAAIGPGVWITDQPIPIETEIHIDIVRNGTTVFSGDTDLRKMKRQLPELVEYLFRDNIFNHGCYLMTGTGIVPPDNFSLHAGDEMRVTIPPLGMLSNTIE